MTKQSSLGYGQHLLDLDCFIMFTLLILFFFVVASSGTQSKVEPAARWSLEKSS